MGIHVLYKKSPSDKIIHVSSHNRRVSGNIINFTSNFSCLSLSVYLPYDNYSTVYVNHEYTECIDYIESLHNTANCSAFICCGDYNCSFDRSNAQTEFLKEFIFRSNFAVSWDHSRSKKDFTYVNIPLNFFSCIDHIVMSKNVFNYITDNFVLSDQCNHSSHNIVYMSISVPDLYRITQIDCNRLVFGRQQQVSK